MRLCRGLRAWWSKRGVPELGSWGSLSLWRGRTVLLTAVEKVRFRHRLRDIARATQLGICGHDVDPLPRMNHVPTIAPETAGRRPLMRQWEIMFHRTPTPVRATLQARGEWLKV